MSYLFLIIVIILIVIVFKWDIKEKFLMSPHYPYLNWMPTRNTRLMSYDLRGDPHGLIIYPSYYSWLSPFSVYRYGPAVYNITGNYIIPRPIKKNITKKEIKEIKKVEDRVKGKEN